MSLLDRIKFMTYLFLAVSLTCLDCMKASFVGEGHLGAFLALGATELQILPLLVNWVGKPDDSSV